MKFYSQSNQDKWIVETLKGKREGYFLDIGAYDGINTSNTYVLEKELGWNGICIEANPVVFNTLINTRKTTCLNLALLDYKGLCNFGTDAVNKPPFYVVNCDTLTNVLLENMAPNVIDYLSIDVEGAEYTILKDFPFDKWQINLMTVEHNLYLDGPAKQEQLFNLLSKRGFIRAVKDAPCLDTHPMCHMKPYEDWWINEKFNKSFYE